MAPQQSPNPPKVRVQFVTPQGRTMTTTLDDEGAVKVSRVLREHWGLVNEPHTWVRLCSVKGWGRLAGLFECRGCGARAQLPDGGTLMEERAYVALAGVPTSCPCTDDPPPPKPLTIAPKRTNSSKSRARRCTRSG